MATPQYRLTVYAPRSVDPTEATILTPRAGADHADPFRVATCSGVAGFQPYLAALPKGKRCEIDFKTKATNVGQLTFSIGDKRLGTNNLSRWVTAFAGNAAGEDQFKGCKVVAEESLDFDPANPGAATWTRYYTGRILAMPLDGRLKYTMQVRDTLAELDRNVFVGAPAAAIVGSYATQSHYFPLGLIQPYGPFPVEPTWVKGTVVGPDGAGGFYIQTNTGGQQRSHASLVIAKVFGDVLNGGADTTVDGDAPTVSGQAAIALLLVRQGGVVSTWEFTGGVRGSTLEQADATPLPGSGAIPATGSTVEYYVRPSSQPVSDALPLLVSDVHPVTYIRHLLAGAYGVLDAAGTPLWSVAVGATFAALEADPSFMTWRSIERKTAKLADVITAVCVERHLAIYPNADGAIEIADLRRVATITPTVALANADVPTSATPTWEPNATEAIPAVQVTYYHEEFIPDTALPKPFDVIPAGGYPDVPVVRIDDSGTNVLRVQGLGPRTGDVSGDDLTLDAKGLRYADGGAVINTTSTEYLAPFAELINGRPKRTLIDAYVTQFASEIRAPYALGPTTGTLDFRRTAVANAMPGTWATLTVNEVPDPASNRRGGTRLVLILSRTEDGETVSLELLDAGANGVAVTPVLGAPAAVAGDTRALAVPVTLDAAGDPVELQIACTPVGTGAAPAPTDPAWHTAATPEASGTVTVTGLPGATRVWVRGRSHPTAGTSNELPSAYVAAGGAGYLDTGAIAAPTALAVLDDAGYAALAWTPGDATLREEVFLTTGAAPATWTDAMRVVRLEAGSTAWRVGPLTSGTQYSVGVCTIDEYGGRSAFATVTFTCYTAATPSAPTDATPFAGSHDAAGMLINDGTYGLAVAATQYPGLIEFQEAVETGPGTNVFGAFASVARTAAVQGDWTKCTRTAPNDGKRRRLSARAIDGAAASAWTDGVDVLPWTPTELPLFARTVGSADLTNLVITEPDATHTAITWTRGARVAFVWLYDRLAPMPVSATPWPNPTDGDYIVLHTGTDSYTTAKPGAGFARFVYLVPWIKSGATFVRGTAVKVPIMPAPAALAIKGSAAVTNGTADLSAAVTLAPSDAPATLTIYEDDPSAAPLASFVGIGASATFTKADNAAFGARALPQRAQRHWWGKLVNAAGVEDWAHWSADRDPLPYGHITTTDFNLTPAAAVDVDSDTDTVRFTVPGGKTKTVANVGGLDTITYTAVTDALDDGTHEAAFALDESRGPYLVEVQGGGQWLAVWRGNLHGKPSHAPRAKSRGVRSADGATEDVYVTLETDVPERVTLQVRVGEGAGAPIYTLCASAVDPTTRYVDNGTEVGPADFFAPTVGAPAAVLAAIALGRDQITRYADRAIGEQSQVSGDWDTIALSLMAKPYVDAFATQWDEVNQLLRFDGKAGPHSASWLVELDDNPGFTSPLTFTGAAVEGDAITDTQTLTGANRGKVWYGRCRTYSQAAQAGLESSLVIAQTAVPALVTCDVSGTESPGQGTLTVVVHDKGGFVDPAVRCQAWITQNGTRTLTAPTTAPPAGQTDGTYTFVFALVEDHDTRVEPDVQLLDASHLLPNAVTFDADTIANVVNLDSATDGPNATVVATCDSDAITGAGTGGGRYRVDGGAWTVFDVSAMTRQASFVVPLVATGTRTVDVQAQNAHGAWGPIVSTVVPIYAPAAGLPSLTVTPTPGSASYSIAWTGTGTVQLAIDGAPYGTPAPSPIVVTRDGSDHTYAFTAALNGLTMADAVTVPALGSDTVTPDLTVVPGTPTATQQPYTVSATNPKAGGAAPTITVTPFNCTMVIGGTTFSTAQTIASGTVVTVNRPASGSTTMAHVTFRATITGGGAETVGYDVQPQFGLPTLTVSAVPGATSYQITYGGTGTIQYAFNGGALTTPPASPITVTRTASDQTYTFQATLGGQSVIDTVTVPALGTDTVTPDLEVTPGTTTSTQQPFTVAATNPKSGGAAPTITAACSGCTMVYSGTTYAAGTTIAIPSGAVVTANRPSTTNTAPASITFKAEISGGGAETIQRTVLNQLNTGPSLTVTPTPGSTSYSIAYGATGTVQYEIDNGSWATPPSNPFTVARSAAGGADHVVTLQATADGQSVSTTVTVPAQAASGGGSSSLGGTFGTLTNAVHAYGNPGTVDFGFPSSGFGASVAFRLWVRDDGRYGDELYHLFTTTGTGASSYTYTAGESISTTILNPTVTIGFYVEAIDGSTVGPHSTDCETVYNT